MKDNKQKAPASGKKGKLLWSLLFIIIAAATVWAVASQSREFSLSDFAEYIKGASKPWLAAALAAAAGFIIFEGEAVRALCRGLDYKSKHRSGFVYSAADIYFSAITPSATGGQPMCAYFMMRDGIPGAVATVILIANLTMYTSALLAIGAVTILIAPGVFTAFGTLSKVFIIVGGIIQILFTVLFVFLMKNGHALRKICAGVLRFLCRLHILKSEKKKLEKLDSLIENYCLCAELMQSRKKMLFKVFILNLFQRISYISVILFTFLASGGNACDAFKVWAMEALVVLGSNSMPIPGAMGVSDYLMLDGFRAMVPGANAANLELLSRSISFYFCIIVCGITTLAAYLICMRRKPNDRLL